MPDPIQPPTGLKPGYKTTEFWVVVLTTIATLAGQLDGLVPPPWGVVISGIAAAAYAISRGLAKSGQPPSP